MTSSDSQPVFDLESAVVAVRDVAIAVASFRTVPEIVGAIAHGLRQLPGSPAVTVGVALDDEGPLRLMAYDGFDPATIDKWATISRDVPVPLTEVLRTGEVMCWSSRAAFFEDYPDLRDDIEASEHHAWVALPMISEIGPSGCLGMAWDHEREFGDVEQFYFLTLGKLGGEALRRASREIDRRELVLLLADASDHERMEIARDLHDRSVQQLAAASIRIGSVKMDHFGDLAPEVREAITMVEADVQDVIRSLRNIIVNLHPPDMDHLDLGQAVSDFAEWLFESRSDVSVDDDVSLPMSEPIAELSYRIITEALSNAARHAAASAISVRIGQVDVSSMELVVEDDGVGYDQSQRGELGHLGLRMIAERVSSVGGSLDIESDDGVRLTVRLPLTAPRH